MDAASFVALLGGLLILSYAADILFETTRVPGVVILIGLGVLLGPLLRFLPGAELQKMAPYFGAVALVVILFEAGLGLDLDESAQGLLAASVLALGSYVVTAGLLAVIARTYLDLPWTSAAALGSLLGVPSSAVVIPLATRLTLSADLKTVAVLESAIADVLGILGAGIAIEAAGGAPVGLLVVRRTFVGFTIGAFVAFGVGILWNRLLRRFRFGSSSHLGEVLTFGVVLLLDGVVQTLGGASAIAIVAFGLVLANEPAIMERLLKRPLPVEHELVFQELRNGVNRFAGQMTFLVRTFFFVFLGAVVSWEGIGLKPALTATLFVGAVLVIRPLCILGARKAGLLELTTPQIYELSSLFPRGLVTAVLAFEAVDAKLPGAESFPFYAFLLLVFTNLFMVLSLRAARPGKPEPLPS